MALLQQGQHGFRRPAKGGALAGDDDRPLQQDRMRGDRLGDVGLGEIGFLLAELLELGLTVANQAVRIAADEIDQLLDL